MINTSNEYKQYIRANREFVIGGTITLSSTKIITLSNSNVMLGGFEISEGVSDEDTFSIGSAIIRQCKITLDNSSGEFDEDDFRNGVILPTIGLKLSSSTEVLQKGKFTIDSAEVIGKTIVLYSLDNLYKLDRPFSELTVNYPIQIGTLLTNICSHCDVPYTPTSFTNSTFEVAKAFDTSAVTFRDIVSYIAQIAGSYVKSNNSGYLVLSWYNMSAFEQTSSIDGGEFDSSLPYTTGGNVDGGDFTFGTTIDYDGGTFLQMNNYFHIFSTKSSTFEIDDVVITGIKVSATLDNYEDSESYLFGTSGYVLEISNNPLIQIGMAETVATTVGAKIVGMQFRPYEVSCISDPSYESGDVGYISDVYGNSYQCIISTLIYTLGNFEKLSCITESPSRNSSIQYSASTKTIVEARKNIVSDISNYDLVVQTMTELITNGLGLYQTVIGDDYIGKVVYQHDKPTMEESLYRWLRSTGGYIQQTRPTTADEWITTSGEDVYGNALYNTLTVRGLNADWIKVGGSNNQDGSLKVYDSDGILVAKLDKDGIDTSSAHITGGTISISGSGDSLIMLSLPEMGLAYDLSVLFQKYTNSLNGNYSNASANGFSIGNTTNQLGAFGVDNGVPVFDIGNINVAPRISANGYSGASGSLDVITGISYDGTTLSWTSKTLTFKNGIMVTAL